MRPLLLACALFAFCACDDDDSGTGTGRVEVTLDAEAIELMVGETHTLTARVTPEAAAGEGVEAPAADSATVKAASEGAPAAEKGDSIKK